MKQQPFTLDVATGQFFETREERDAGRAVRKAHDAIRRDYTPDFGLVLADGRRVVVEVKDPRYLGDDAYQQKLGEARVIFAANGLEFVVMSLIYDPNAPLVFNANVLSTALHANNHRPDLGSIQAALEKVLEGGSAPLGEVIVAVGLTMRDAPTLFLKALLMTDMRRDCLSSASEVSLAYGDIGQFKLLPL